MQIGVVQLVWDVRRGAANFRAVQIEPCELGQLRELGWDRTVEAADVLEVELLQSADGPDLCWQRAAQLGAGHDDLRQVRKVIAANRQHLKLGLRQPPSRHVLAARPSPPLVRRPHRLVLGRVWVDLLTQTPPRVPVPARKEWRGRRRVGWRRRSCPGRTAVQFQASILAWALARPRTAIGGPLADPLDERERQRAAQRVIVRQRQEAHARRQEVPGHCAAQRVVRQAELLELVHCAELRRQHTIEPRVGRGEVRQ